MKLSLTQAHLFLYFDSWYIMLPQRLLLSPITDTPMAIKEYAL